MPRSRTLGWIGVLLVLPQLAGCFRYGFLGASDGANQDATWDAADGAGDGPDGDGDRPDAVVAHDAGDGALPDRARDAPPLASTAPLANTGADPLNGPASGTLLWTTCGPSFTGEVVVKDLSAGHTYQLKLEQSWSVDHQTGKNLGAVGRTWDETIWLQGDTAGVLPAPYTGVAAGNVSAANVGDYLTPSEQDALYQAGHDLTGYLLFAFFKLLDDATATYTEDDTSPATQVLVQADGFHFPIDADFSWHTSTAVQKGAVSLPAGPYRARFLVTREGSTYLDPLTLGDVTFSIGSCP